MPDLREDFRLALKARARFVVQPMKNLDRHRRAMRISRPIHIGESAASQTCYDAIAANGGAGRQDAIVAGQIAGAL